MWSFEWNGISLPVTTMFDSDGDETNDPAEAVTLVAGPMADGKWLACACFLGEIKRSLPQ